MYRVDIVQWLVKKVKDKATQHMRTTDTLKGDTIKESEPVKVNYSTSKMVGYGQLSSITCKLYSFECPSNRNPSLYVDQGM